MFLTSRFVQCVQRACVFGIHVPRVTSTLGKGEGRGADGFLSVVRKLQKSDLAWVSVQPVVSEFH